MNFNGVRLHCLATWIDMKFNGVRLQCLALSGAWIDIDVDRFNGVRLH